MAAATDVRQRASDQESAGQAAHERTIARYRDYVTTSFVAAIEPVAVAKAEGATVWDQDGAAYVDCFAGISVVINGLAMAHDSNENVKRALSGTS